MSKRHNYHDLSPEERLRGGRVTRSAYQYAVTWLDDCGDGQIKQAPAPIGPNSYQPAHREEKWERLFPILDELGFVAVTEPQNPYRKPQAYWIRIYEGCPWLLWQHPDGRWVTQKPLIQTQIWQWRLYQVTEADALRYHQKDPDQVYEYEKARLQSEGT